MKKSMRYMAKMAQWTLGAMATLLVAVGCSDFSMEESVKGNGGDGSATPPALSADINPSVGNMTTAMPAHAKGRLSTRALINDGSTVSFMANFLRVDEDVDSNPVNPADRNRGL